MTPQTASSIPETRPAGVLRIAALFAAAAFVLQMAVVTRYGYFRDELYFIACTEHLALGYVDHAPLTEWLFWPVRALLGSSLPAIRLLPAMSAVAKLLLVGLLVREFGGGRFAAALACLGVLLAPLYLAMDHILSMNTFEPLFWTAAAYALVLTVRRNEPRRLLWFGAAIGLALLTKHSGAFFAIACVLALLFTRDRKLLWSRYMWFAGGLAFLLFLPHLIWQFQNGFPIIETLQTVKRTGKNVELSPVAYVAHQLLLVGPASILLWGVGLVWLLRGRFRFLAYAYLLTLAILIALKGKDYYLGPAYPMLFAAGGVAWERVHSRVARMAVTVAVSLLGIVSAPLVLPLLSPEGYVAYTRALHFEQPKAERGHRGPLPQHFGDMFGWPEMVAKVAQAYNSLPAEERAKAAIFAENYGEAGAIDLLGPAYGLPKAISRHNNYWLWGPRDYTGEVVIVLNGRLRDEREHFTTVEIGPHVEHPWAMGYENFDIYICRGLKRPLKDVWPQLKLYN